jgi:hypothetical protein
MKNEKGYSTLIVIIILTLSVMVGIAGLDLALSQQKNVKIGINKKLAFQIAEAGVNYYQWHLAHDPDDYQDDTGGPGPYVHDYKNATGEIIGQFSLEITPPPLGSTITTIRSTGYSTANPNNKKVITVEMGIPAFSNFALVANDVMRFGQGTETFGPIHSNDGIRFDGVANGLLSSACTSYNDPDHSGPNEDCVHTHEPDPNDVFLGGTAFPVSPVDFNGITADLAQAKIDAQANGIYRAPSGSEGYYVNFKTDNTFDIYEVNSLATCEYRWFFWWVDWPNVLSVGATSTETLNIPYPSNGLIFLEDNVWVGGQINGNKITLIAAEEPLATGNANIYTNDDLTYTNNDGTDVIGLIAQNDIEVTFYSEDNLELDAAVIAQRGNVGRYYYQPHGGSYNPAGCGDNVYRDTVTLNGSIGTNERYGWAYTDGTGYTNRIINYDADLTFGPPPSFPTTGEYELLSWDEE